ncbi:uncharacterized protein LOC128875092 [Hylaeus volcanicus]|uniref:uncharacterized protein LOC128875092 n=1 Tax=Hylaeus volcanicus TaxID=313075 RepID=UPI0023B7E2B4|nr:uncharacterized protein LOC128875092 [Hylaeus volcanicus]
MHNNVKLKIGLWNARSIGNKIDELKEKINNYDIMLITETWIIDYTNYQIQGYQLINNGNDFNTVRIGNKTYQQGCGLGIYYKEDINLKKIKSHKVDKKFETLVVEVLDSNQKGKFQLGLIYRTNGNKVNRTSRLYKPHKIDWKEFRIHLANKKEEINNSIQQGHNLAEKYNNWKQPIIEYFEVRNTDSQHTQQYRHNKTTRNTNPRPKNNRTNIQRKTQPRWWDEECTSTWSIWKKYQKDLWKHGRIEDYENMMGWKTRWKILKREKKRTAWENLIQEMNNNTNITKIWNKIRGIKKRYTENIDNLETKVRKDLEDIEINKIIDNNETMTSITTHTAPIPQEEDNNHTRIWNISIDKIEMLQTIEKNRNKKSAPGVDGIDYKIIAELPLYMKDHLHKIYEESWNTGEIPPDWRRGEIIMLQKPGKKAFRPITLTSCVGKTLERIINNRLQLWLEENQKLENNQAGFRKNKSTMDNLIRITNEIKHNNREKANTVGIFIDIKGAYDNVNLVKLLHVLRMINCPSTMYNWIRNWLNNRKVTFNHCTQGIKEIDWKKGVPQGAILSPTLFNIYINGLQKKIDDERTFTLLYADDIVIVNKYKKDETSLHPSEIALRRLVEHLEIRDLTIAPEKTKVVRFQTNPKLEEFSINVVINNKKTAINSSPEAKFLGITLDYNLRFRTHFDDIIYKAKKRLGIIQFLCRGQRGINQNWGIKITRALISSVVDYGAYIIYTKEGNLEQNKKIRKIESAALRAAIGYRMSTPIAVMYADTGFIGHHLRAKQAAIRYWLREMEKTETNSKTLDNQLKYFSIHNDTDHLTQWEKGIGTKPNLIETSFYEIAQLKNRILSTNHALESSFNWKEKILNKRKNLKKIYIDKDTGKTLETGAIPLSTINQFLMDKHNVKKEDTVICYTDGSKQENKIANGIGIYINLPQGTSMETGYSIHKEATIYTTEAIGIFKAIELTKHTNCKNTLILTDSLSALTGLESKIEKLDDTDKNNNNAWILKIYKTLINQKDREKIVLIWVPGHQGIPGNEKADSLAKEYTNKVPEEDIPITRLDYLVQYKHTIWSAFSDRVEEIGRSKGAYYFSNFWEHKKKVKFKPWFQKFGNILDRHAIRSISRIRSNHYNLKESLGRKGIIDDQICDCKMEEESVDHVLFRCPFRTIPRLKMFDKIGTLINNCNYNVAQIISSEKISALKEIIAFLKEANIEL